MTEEKKTINPDDQPIMKKSKLPIPLITAGLAIAAGVGAFFYINSHKDLKVDTNKTEVNQEEKQVEEKDEITLNEKIENIDFGYKGNLNIEINMPEQNIESKTTLKNFQILSMDQGLRSNISFDTLSFEGSENGYEYNNEFKNLDFTTNETISYINVNNESLKDGLMSLLNNEKLVSAILEDGKYAKIDNAKRYIELIGSDDEIVNGLIKGIMSPNTYHYLEKYGINEQAKKKFFSKDSYKILFKNLEEKEGKQYIGLKENSCDFVMEIAKKLEYPLHMTSEECKTQLEIVNGTLGQTLYIIQEGEKETLNYDDGQNKASLTYENGDIASFTMESPFGPSINYEEELLKVSYDSGIMGKQFGFSGKLSLEIDFANNIAYKVVGTFKQGNLEMKISGSGDREKGKVGYMYTESGVILSKGQWQYQGVNHGFSINGKYAEISGKIAGTDSKKQWQIEAEWTNPMNKNAIFLSENAKSSQLSIALRMLVNDEGGLPTEGLTPISYNGEIITYQGEFSTFLNTLEENGIKINNYISEIPTLKNGKDYIISISNDGWNYSLAASSKYDGETTNISDGNFWGNITLENGEKLYLNSLVYKGDYVDGLYTISKTNLENEDDLNGFVEHRDTENLVYNLDTEKTEKTRKFDNSLVSKGLMELNGSKEIKTLISTLDINSVSGVSSKTNISLKEGNLKLNMVNAIEEEKILEVTGQGKWGINDTDIDIVMSGSDLDMDMKLTHKDNISSSIVNINNVGSVLKSEISSNIPYASMVGNMANAYIFMLAGVSQNTKENNSRRLGDIGAIERALITWRSDWELNSEGILATGGLTPISYNGEIIAYQGSFTDYFNGSLKESGFDVLQKVIKDPDEEHDYIISISADGKYFSAAATIENEGSPTTSIRQNLLGEISLKNGETLNIGSLIYEQKDGKPIKTELETEEDLAGFLFDDDERILYEPTSKEDVKTYYDLSYKTSEEGNKNIIDGQYKIYKENEEPTLSVTLKGDISKEGFEYNIPENMEEIIIDPKNPIKIQIPNMSGFYKQNNFTKTVLGTSTILATSSYIVLQKWLGKSRDSRRLGDIVTVERSLTVWRSDYEYNPTGLLTTGSLTPITYQGEIIAYQGNFSDYFQELKKAGFDSLKKAFPDPNGIDQYVIAISANGKYFSIAATLENNGKPKTVIRQNRTSGTEITLENGETISITSLIYAPMANIYELETKDDLEGFLSDNGTDMLPYSLED